MATPAERIARLEEAVDVAAGELLDEYCWLELPEGTELENLQVELGNAIAAVMRSWL